jgi:hypothetical protein
LTDIVTSVTGRDLPIHLSLAQNFPNPFNPTTTIVYSLSNREFVELSVFDLLGRKTATLASGVTEPGEHRITFDAGGLPSGVYFYRLRTRDFEQTRKFVLLR